ncbi:MAG: substrate-binding domain-containing protein [Nitrospirae bacterium]|nr:substrate-binding domain-containing protein [Nitrospirota bacterium]
MKRSSRVALRASNLLSSLMLFSTALFSPSVAFATDTLLIASGCSVSNIGYLNDLAREYERRNPEVTLLVRGGGSPLGISELTFDKTDFAASCMSRRPDDPDYLEFIPVAWDALVFITHKSNPMNNISVDNVRRIYEGTVMNWKQIGGPDMPLKSFMSKPPGMSGAREALEKYVMKEKDIVPQPNSIVLDTSVATWEQMIETTPEGFSSTGFASARRRNVKMLKVDGIAPTKENIISGKYPFRRKLYLVINKLDYLPETRHFVEFATGREGQRIISSLGIPSLADIKQEAK